MTLTGIQVQSMYGAVTRQALVHISAEGDENIDHFVVVMSAQEAIALAQNILAGANAAIADATIVSYFVNVMKWDKPEQISIALGLARSYRLAIEAEDDEQKRNGN